MIIFIDDELRQKMTNLQNQINEINGELDNIRMGTGADVYNPSQSSHSAKIDRLESAVNQIKKILATTNKK